MSRILLEEHSGINPAAPHLVVDDSDGTLTRAVRDLAPHTRSVCDVLSHEAHIAPEILTQAYPVVTGGVALVRLPKSLSGLAEICHELHAAGYVHVLFGGRVKHMSPQQNDVISRYFADFSASRGKYKSRVLRASQPREDAPAEASLWRQVPFAVPGGDLHIWSRGATYGWGKIDQGTRFLLQHLLPRLGDVDGTRVSDLGCGSGLISVSMAAVRNDFKIQASDVSKAAILSIQRTIAANGFNANITVTRQGALADTPPASLDLVVTNPPFHEGTTVNPAMSADLFHGAARALAPGGEMWCVYNSMLHYKPLLTQIVGATEIVARNPKFTITRSMKRG